MGWRGIGDWLGTGRLSNRNRSSRFRSFADARAYARNLGLKSVAEWHAFRRQDALPDDIPTDPSIAYRSKGWDGWGDWLGTGAISTQLRKYRPYAEARAYVRQLKLMSSTEWRNFCKSGRLPVDIPRQPRDVYKDDGWEGMGEWLGTGNNSTRERSLGFLSFEEARKFARGLNLESQAEWKTYCKAGNPPPEIPRAPVPVYRDRGWVSWPDWLGTSPKRKPKRSSREP